MYANKNSESPEFRVTEFVGAMSVRSTQIDRTDEAEQTFTVACNNARKTGGDPSEKKPHCHWGEHHWFDKIYTEFQNCYGVQVINANHIKYSIF